MIAGLVPQKDLDKMFTGLETHVPRLQRRVPLSRHSWFRVGGEADFFLDPGSVEELATTLSLLPEDVPVTYLGGGSNCLIRDGGIAGLVVRLGKGFSGFHHSDCTITAGAGLPDIHAARAASEAGLSGLEFMIGIPGTCGGAVAMNAGAHDHEISDIFRNASALDRRGNLHVLTADDLAFGYRQSGLPDGFVITDVSLAALPFDKATIEATMADFLAARDQAQPTGLRTGGSSFKNPPGDKAWALIDQAGCRDLRVGAAALSPKHCNFMVNEGGASAADLESLGEQIRHKVAKETGVLLEWEIERLGIADTQGAAP